MDDGLIFPYLLVRANIEAGDTKGFRFLLGLSGLGGGCWGLA
jgi:hypothetical protein